LADVGTVILALTGLAAVMYITWKSSKLILGFLKGL
jgi:hypothetical protein